MKKTAITICLAIFLISLAPSSVIADSSQKEAPAIQQWEHLNPKKLKLRSKSALIADSRDNLVYAKEADKAMPIASITKLMTAMVILDSGVDLEEKIRITKADRDLLRLTGSRLKYGATLSRKNLLMLALMASENRAAHALGRTFPGGLEAFVKAMNKKAAELGMTKSQFAGPTGLDAKNIASAHDLARMVKAAYGYPMIRDFSTRTKATVRPYKRKGPLNYGNTNRLVKRASWEIGLSKTGYINEAGRCLVMQAEIDNEPMTIVFLNSFGKLTPLGDAGRLRRWVENASRKETKVAQKESASKQEGGA